MGRRVEGELDAGIGRVEEVFAGRRTNEERNPNVKETRVWVAANSIQDIQDIQDIIQHNTKLPTSKHKFCYVTLPAKGSCFWNRPLLHNSGEL